MVRPSGMSFALFRQHSRVYASSVSPVLLIHAASRAAIAFFSYKLIFSTLVSAKMNEHEGTSEY
jgi:hypothetical protein